MRTLRLSLTIRFMGQRLTHSLDLVWIYGLQLLYSTAIKDAFQLSSSDVRVLDNTDGDTKYVLDSLNFEGGAAQQTIRVANDQRARGPPHSAAENSVAGSQLGGNAEILEYVIRLARPRLRRTRS